MKNPLARSAGCIAAIILAASFQLRAQPVQPNLMRLPPVVDQVTLTTNTISIPSAITPQAVLGVMQRVADWQLAHPITNRPTGWICSVGDVGMMALAGISGDPKYRDAMLAKGETNAWVLPQYQGRKYHADDQCYGQVCAELYFLYRENRMIAPMREHFDWILANPPTDTSVDARANRSQQTWSWCDALFMAPPAWMRLYAATGDTRYLDFAVTNWWRTADFLYDKDEHLFYRDANFFNQAEANGKKIFWSRGNGWVFAATVRMLQYLPMNSPERPHFEQLFKDMAAKILSLQQPDGMWRASLLDPDSYPMPEASGSGMFTYGLAWGVNQGLLDRAAYEPAVRKAWQGLVGCVDADGKLTHVQPAGSAPVKFAEDSTAPYGGGIFLLAGSEVYRMAVNSNATHALGEPFNEKFPFLNPSIALKISNPSSFKRDCETVEISLIQTIVNQWKIEGSQKSVISIISKYVSDNKFSIMDGVSSRILDSQIYSSTDSNSAPDKLLFQVDLAPGETKTFYILDASALAAVPPPIVKTFARYVPERHDDFAWESDRIAHRMFGPALETWQAEPLTSSGVDVWIKRTRDLIINLMYGSGVYYDTNGLAQDDFKVGKTRGDGGLGIWDGQKLYVSKNWRTWKLITTGPIRSEFELTYDAWDAGGRKVSETKRISIDAGSNLSRVESTFSSDDKSPLEIGVGLAERPGENVILNDSPITTMDTTKSTIDSWQTSTAKGLVVQDKDEGWMAYWQPQDFAKGTTTVAIILPGKNTVQMFTNDLPDLPASAFAAPTHTVEEGQPAIRNLLAIAPAEIGKPFVYYLGAGWSESGDFPDAKSWTDYVRRFAERRDQPLQVTVGN